jgi:hypothetical protein
MASARASTVLEKASQPGAALRIAELILKETGDPAGTSRPLRPFEAPKGRPEWAGPGRHSASQVQLCDFHIHTNYSDGRLTLPEVGDFYGRRKFDCICITDQTPLDFELTPASQSDSRCRGSCG